MNQKSVKIVERPIANVVPIVHVNKRAKMI